MLLMRPPPASQSLLELPLVRDAGALPLQHQLHDRLHQAILDGRLAAGSHLPGSRALATTLGVSRNTVAAVYEQLLAEGYVESDRQGTRVLTLSRPLSWQQNRPAGESAGSPEPRLAERIGGLYTAHVRLEAPAYLRPGIPDLAHFPVAAWQRSLDRALHANGPATLDYGDPLGEPALRAAIAHHIGPARGVRCEPDQVVITNGAHGALQLCVLLLTNPGDTAWVEDPGYRGAKAALQAGNLQVLPKRVDGEGILISSQDWQGETPRLIYTTPSHQYPTGAVMSATRRLSLLEAAQKHGAWIIEDDYDSEFRHAGSPIAAIQGLFEHTPVLYIGSFSKTLFPSLRLGFVVLPRQLLAAARPALGELLRCSPRHNQLALADFISNGQFSRHLGRMRRLYRARQLALREALHKHLQIPHTLDGGLCGLHLTIHLPPAWNDKRLAAALRAQGLNPFALSGFALAPRPEDNGLVLGYGNTPTELLEPLVRKLAEQLLAT